jgi:hypothetical protein
MAFLGLFGKKKNDFEIPGSGGGMPPGEFGVPHEGPPMGGFSPPEEAPSAFGREAPSPMPSFSMPPSPASVPQQQGFDQQQLVLAKLDAIRAVLDSVVQRLERIERLAQQTEEEAKPLPRWR